MTTSGVGAGGNWQSSADTPNVSTRMRLVPVPASSAAPGSPGDFAMDNAYLYVYVTGLGLWRRISMEAY
jgi:hypothetical protein